MRICTCGFLLLTVCVSLGRPAFSQSGTDPSIISVGTGAMMLGDLETKTIYSSRGSLHTVTVFKDDRRHLDRQAVVKIERKGDSNGYWRATDNDSQSVFPDLLPGEYNIDVSAAGYLLEHRSYLVGMGANSYRLEIILQSDPASVDLSTPITAQTSPKIRKAIERATSALRNSDYKRAQKLLEAAHQRDPSSGDVNFLLGYLFVQTGDLERAVPYVAGAATENPHSVRALTLLGRLRLQQKDFGDAKTALEQAVAVDGDYWLAHNLLAEAYLQRREFEKARDHAQIAIAKAKGAAKATLLVLGYALADLGRDQEAIQALNDYARALPNSPAIPQVMDLIGQLERRPSDPNHASHSPLLPMLAQTQGSPGDTDELRLSIKTWEPPGVDDARPTVAAGVTCPSNLVIEEAGERVKELVNAVSRFAAIEQLQHETVDELGRPLTREARQYNYLVDISELRPGVFAVSEFRDIESRLADFPGHMATQGLPAIALVFHPRLRDTFQLTCEGLGEWQGQATWLVYFRQRDDRPNRLRAYRIGENYYAVNLKGRAWISADKFQIVHIETDLIKPMPSIQLLSEHESVEYGVVAFPEKKTELWLPKSAELYFDFQRQRFHRRHSFDNFMLFSVESHERPKDPVVPPPATPAEPPRN
jgi:tetratricopeptide (TPR) repeat protein